MNPANVSADYSNFSFALPIYTTQQDDSLKEHWRAWSDIYADGSNESRDIAFMRLLECLRLGSATLDLSGLCLTELPKKLPPCINELIADNNQLTELPPELPSGLKKISIENNWLCRLPDDLPPGLIKLKVSANQLQELPASLPPNLAKLYANNNQITQLPDTLPDSIIELMVIRNDLSTLPETLPVELKILDAKQNVLLKLPDNLPNKLKSLNLAHNMLLNVDINWPPSLEKLTLSHNRLTSLPNNLPSTLLELSVHDNQLTVETLPDFQRLSALCFIDLGRNFLRDVPDTIMYLMPTCTIFLENNLFTDSVRERINASSLSLNYNGPQIMFSLEQYGVRVSVPALHEVVTRWCPPQSKDKICQLWQDIASENNALSIHFAQFLLKLSDSIYSIIIPDFKQYIGQWLDRMAAIPDLRQQIMLIAQEAAESCGDRLALTLNDMEKAQVIYDIEHGRYDNDTQALITRAREMYRHEKLQKLAIARTNAEPKTDAIEIYLAYQVKLNKALALNSPIKQMQFFHLSGLTAKDIEQAETQIKQQENSEFTSWLLLWSPWQQAMGRLDPQNHAQMLATRQSALKFIYSQRLQQQLDTLQWRHDARLTEDAIAVIGKQLSDEIEIECRLPYLWIFLAARNQLALIDPIWPA